MLLTQLYESEPDGDAIYFFASEGTNDCDALFRPAGQAFVQLFEWSRVP
jgi:hypothetical protein